jgi:hypothetical protein
MNGNRWLPLIAALLITVCEVLVLRSQTAHVTQQQGNVAAGTDGESSTFAPGVSAAAST